MSHLFAFEEKCRKKGKAKYDKMRLLTVWLLMLPLKLSIKEYLDYFCIKYEFAEMEDNNDRRNN